MFNYFSRLFFTVFCLVIGVSLAVVGYNLHNEILLRKASFEHQAELIRAEIGKSTSYLFPQQIISELTASSPRITVDYFNPAGEILFSSDQAHLGSVLSAAELESTTELATSSTWIIKFPDQTSGVKVTLPTPDLTHYEGLVTLFIGLSSLLILVNLYLITYRWRRTCRSFFELEAQPCQAWRTILMPVWQARNKRQKIQERLIRKINYAKMVLHNAETFN